ncbi:MAG: hypothetical protein OYG31_01630 [Candidatus Kaiserbacteria bacterium]|nr:hypothetical protein [Candidatus Kaiserbacteria bacterium]
MGIENLFDGLYKLFAKDFLRHPGEGSFDFSEYIDAGLTRCRVVQDEIATQFQQIEEEMQKEEHGIAPETFKAVQEELGRIKEDVAKAAGYFEQQAQQVRSDDEKPDDVLIELYNFAKEKRLSFGDRIKKLEDMIGKQ